MKSLHLQLGIKGEDIACNFLTKKGYEIIARNVRAKWGELDVVAIARDKTLVFIEVKSMHEGALSPEDQMSASKRKKFARAAEMYANKDERKLIGENGWRLDVIAIIFRGEEYEIRHYENIE